MQEPPFEKVLRNMRIGRVIKHIPKDAIVVDIGCGYDAQFLHDIKGLIQKGIGIDQKVELTSKDNIELRKMRLGEKIPVDKNSADAVTMMAVLEHVEHPQELMNESYELLKPGGVFLATTPTPRARPVLEFLSFKLGIVNKDEILDHKNYFWGFQLYNMLKKAGFREVEWHEFQLGMNTFIKATK